MRESIDRAARLGAKGLAFDAIGELAPDRLSETGRREIRKALESRGLALIAVGLPTRRGLDTLDQLEDRLRRADRAFSMAYELRSPLVTVQAGAVPPESEAERLGAFRVAIGELDRLAANRGVIVALELGGDDPVRLAGFLRQFQSPHLAVSVDPGAQLGSGGDPAVALTELNDLVAHAYAGDLGPAVRRPVNHRDWGFAPGALDWEAYLGALEEIRYRGFLTVWPAAGADPDAAFKAVVRLTETL